MPAITKIEGQLEIHHDRGVIYFHSKKTGWTAMRICSLPKPIPDLKKVQIDITHMHGTSYAPAPLQTKTG